MNSSSQYCRLIRSSLPTKGNNTEMLANRCNQCNNSYRAVTSLHNLADCSLTQRANAFSKVAHISTPVFVLTDLLTNWVAWGITIWYNKLSGYPVPDTKQGYMTRKNIRGDDLQRTAKPLFTGLNPVVASNFFTTPGWRNWQTQRT